MNKHFIKPFSSKKTKQTVLLAGKDIKEVRETKALLSLVPDISEVQCFLSVEALLSFCGAKGPRQNKALPNTIIMTDLNVPCNKLVMFDPVFLKKSGLYILKTLRNQEKYKQTPIVLVSDKVSQQDVSIACTLLASAFLQTPHDIEILRRVIKTGWGWPHSPPPVMQTKEQSQL